MEVIIYSQNDNPQKNRLIREVSQIPDLTYAMTFDFKNLFRLVKSKISDQVVIIFLISSSKELEYLISNREYLFNSRFILILLDEEESLISKALSLSPRYLAHTGYGFTDVAAVIDKMIQNNDKISTWNDTKRNSKQMDYNNEQQI